MTTPNPSCIDGLPDLPKLPEPYTVASTMKCVSCGAPYEPARALAPHAAAVLGGRLMSSSICKCGSNTFGGTASYDSPSPVQFTANQVFDYATAYGLACYEAGSAAAAQAAKQVPAGFVLVPREPTRAMWLAAEKLLKGPNNAYRIWEDMIAAAPSATSLAEAAEAGQVEAAMTEDERAAVKYYAENPSMALQAWTRQMAPASPQAPCAEQCWACAESGIGCNLVNDCVQAPAPQAVVGEVSPVAETPCSGAGSEQPCCYSGPCCRDASNPKAPAAIVRGGVLHWQSAQAQQATPEGSYLYRHTASAAPHQGADALREAGERQIAEALRQHGLTLMKTATGYEVVKLGPVEAQRPQPRFYTGQQD